MKIYYKNKRSIFSETVENVYNLYKRQLIQYDLKYDFMDIDDEIDPLSLDLLFKIINE